MARLHVLLGCVLIGFCAIDLCFDSIVLLDYEKGDVETILRYYKRTRATRIVQVVQGLLGLTLLSILHSLIFRCGVWSVLCLFLYCVWCSVECVVSLGSHGVSYLSH